MTDHLEADRVCPKLGVWIDIHRALHDAWKEAGEIGEPPPTPVVLGGWWYTPAIVKFLAWDATVRWAAERNLSHLIPELQPAAWATATEAAGMQRHESSYHDPAPTPSEELLATSLERLRHEWRRIAVPFADHTSPVGFTGRKGRRLVVAADYSVQPPWGSWTTLVERKPFTEFRRRVNEVIQPHRVDHIDFARRRSPADSGQARAV